MKRSARKHQRPPVPNPATIRCLHASLRTWYRTHARDLPWRRTRDPYRILLAEIMAQQTQISRVEQFYRQWLKRFPTLKAIANAPREEVLRHWSGLGYNNRALRLRELARIVVEERNGRMPTQPDELLHLPGIGRYTAHALASFAFGARVAVVDVNVRRVVSRLFLRVRHSGDLSPLRDAQDLASRILPEREVPQWNQAMMEIGALVCKARNPLCDECPLSKACKSAFAVQPAGVRNQGPKTEPSVKGILRRVLRGKILKHLHKKPVTIGELARRLRREGVAVPPDNLLPTVRKMEGDGILTLRRRGSRLLITTEE